MSFFTLLCIFLGIFTACNCEYSALDQLDLYQQESFKRFDNQVVYLHFINGSVLPDPNDRTNYTWVLAPDQYRGVFFPVVDDFSELTVSGIAANLRNVSDAWIYLNVSGFISEPRYFKINSIDGFTPYFTGVVSMDSGKITSVTWVDDDCTSCDEFFCVSTFSDAKNCALSYVNDVIGCTEVNETISETINWQELSCDLKIFLAWLGSDSDGTSFTSYGYIPKKFQAYSFYPAYKTLTGIADESVAEN